MIQLYQKKRTGKIWRWAIRTEGDAVITEYGYVDGATQTTSEIAEAMNVGKANEISPVDQAKLIAERHVKDKLDNGYCRTIAEAEASNLGEAIDFANLPTSFCPAKPISSIEPYKLLELYKEGRAIVHRKFDGMCHFVVSHEGGISVLSRGKLEHKEQHVPQIVETLKYLPHGTILNGEICLHPIERDNFKFVSSVLRTKDPARAIELQQDNATLHYIIFDVLYWGGKDISSLPYSKRMQHINDWLSSNSHRLYGSLGVATDLLETYSFNQLFGQDSIVRDHNWEGLVVWDRLDTTEIRFDGKEARKNCYKWKMVHTEDVWATAPRVGKGKNGFRLGMVEGWQYTSDGEFVFVGDVGGGFSDAEREEFWAKKDKIFPCVIEVETPERLVTNKLRFPVFVRLRPDKTQKECIMQLKVRSE